MQDSGDAVADRLRKQQQAMAEFGLFAFRSSDLDKILRRACELVGEGLDVKLTKVLELLPGGREMLMRAGVGWDPGVVGEVRLGADHESPAGYALVHDAPVVSTDVASERRFRIPDVLLEHGVQSMVNVIIAGDQGAYGVLEVDAPRHRAFDEDDVVFLSNYANLLAAAIERHRSHEALEAAVREQRMLAQELAHRVKNTLGLVQALTTQAAADEPAANALRASLLGRFRALASAEELLFHEHGQTIDLAELARRALGPFEGAAGQLVIEGAPVRLPARSGRILSLVLHELATNATKYGALSAADGVARLSWADEREGPEPELRLRWEESGGPELEPSERRGFGTKLLTALAEYELDGRAELNQRSNGLTYDLTFSIE